MKSLTCIAGAFALGLIAWNTQAQQLTPQPKSPNEMPACQKASFVGGLNTYAMDLVYSHLKGGFFDHPFYPSILKNLNLTADEIETIIQGPSTTSFDESQQRLCRFISKFETPIRGKHLVASILWELTTDPENPVDPCCAPRVHTLEVE